MANVGVEAVVVSSVGEVEVVVVKAEVRIIKIKVPSQVSSKVRYRVKRARTLERSTPSTRPPGTRTCRHSRPAPVIGFLGRLLIFVKSQAPAHGKIFGYRRAIAINEIQADSKK